MDKPAFQKKPTNAPIDPALALMRIPPHSVEAEQSLLGGLLLLLAVHTALVETRTYPEGGKCDAQHEGDDVFAVDHFAVLRR